MPRSTPKPSFNPAQHATFAGKASPRATTSEHRTAAIAAPPKPSQPPAWKPPKPENSPGAASFEAPSKSTSPGFGGTLEAHPRGGKPKMGRMVGD